MIGKWECQMLIKLLFVFMVLMIINAVIYLKNKFLLFIDYMFNRSKYTTKHFTTILDKSIMSRTALAEEFGGMRAMIDYAIKKGIVDEDLVTKHHIKKLDELLNTNSIDNTVNGKASIEWV